MNMIVPAGLTPERLATLEFQAYNKGRSPRQVEQMIKRGEDPSKGENGPMIVISPLELAELIRGYKESQDANPVSDP